MFDTSTFGGRVKVLMKRKGLNVDQLARRSNILRNRLVLIMLDQSRPQDDELNKLVIALDIDISELQREPSPNDEAISGQISWILGTYDRMDLFDKVFDLVKNEAKYRRKEGAPVNEYAIRTLIHQLLDEEPQNG